MKVIGEFWQTFGDISYIPRYVHETELIWFYFIRIYVSYIFSD
jgi:hypothetical protein